jgi:hypothetical protein
MIGKRPAKRAAIVTAVTLVPLAVFGGVGFAKDGPSGSEYQYGQYNKVTVCHATGSSHHPWVKISVASSAWLQAHSRHVKKGRQDFLVDATHPCPPVTATTAPTTTTTTHGNHGHHGKP